MQHRVTTELSVLIPYQTVGSVIIKMSMVKNWIFSWASLYTFMPISNMLSTRIGYYLPGGIFGCFSKIIILRYVFRCFSIEKMLLYNQSVGVSGILPM